MHRATWSDLGGLTPAPEARRHDRHSCGCGVFGAKNIRSKPDQHAADLHQVREFGIGPPALRPDGDGHPRRVTELLHCGRQRALARMSHQQPARIFVNRSRWRGADDVRPKAPSGLLAGRASDTSPPFEGAGGLGAVQSRDTASGSYDRDGIGAQLGDGPYHVVDLTTLSESLGDGDPRMAGTTRFRVVHQQKSGVGQSSRRRTAGAVGELNLSPGT